MSGTGIKARLAELRLPKGAPRLWAWSVIGGAYYVLFFFLLRSVLSRPSIPFWTSATLTLTAVLLFANASWNWIFFRKKDLWLSFVFFLPYLLLAFTLAGVLHRIRNPLAGWYPLYPCLSRICHLVGLPCLAPEPWFVPKQLMFKMHPIHTNREPSRLESAVYCRQLRS